MSTWANTTKTLAGLSLDQELFGKKTLKLTRAVAGKGKISPTQLAMQTEVLQPAQTLEFFDPGYSEDDMTTLIPVTLSNTGVTEPYNLYQVGIYAEDLDGEEVLYLIAQTGQTNGEEIPSAEESPGFTIDWVFGLNNGNANTVEVTLNELRKLTVEQADARYVKNELALPILEELQAHSEADDNPHGVTAAQTGAIPVSQKGAAGGIAELGDDGKVLSTQLPTFAELKQLLGITALETALEALISDEVLEAAEAAGIDLSGQTELQEGENNEM